MKKIILFLSFISMTLSAQTTLKFDKINVQCEDKWIAYQMNKDSIYNFGFIYIDAQAGLTYNYEGKFRIVNNVFVRIKEDMPNLKIRLEPNRTAIAEIPEERFNELGIKKFPDWLKFYKTDENSIERLYRWGFMYNGWNECEKALTFLEKAKKIQPNYKGLRVELAFSYNCLEMYEKAISELEGELKEKPTDAYVNKELVYAEIKLGQMEKASESCKKAIEICDDKTYNGENCYNLLHAFYTKKDKINFNLWLETTKKWTSNNTIMTKNINIMEVEMKK